MALLVVVVLGVPAHVSAGQPSVSAPTGPQSGGVFTGTYTFATYISCSSGFSFNSNYSNNLEGTHVFAFYGAADGSLLVTIDGSGMMLVTSCGDPFTGAHTNVANYTVTKYAAGPPPTPTPSATPSPTPTPPPPSGGGGSSGGGSSGGHTSGGGGSAASGSGGATPVPTPTPTITPAATPTPSPTASPTPSLPTITRDTGRTVGLPEPAAAAGSSRALTLGWAAAWLVFLLPLVLLLAALRSERSRERLRTRLAALRLRLEPYWFRLRFALLHHTRHLPKPKIHGHNLPKRRGLSHHHHSGKVLAHHHTSYPALAFLILLATVLAAAVSYTSRADSTLLSLTVTGTPPTTAATIDTPTDGQHFTTASLTVRGSCPSGVLVEIYRNATFAGSTLCDVNGLYAVLMTLTPGQNDLVARVADGLGQYGPDSLTVSVFYDPPAPSPTPSPTATPAPTLTPRPTVKPSAKPTPHPTRRPSPTPAPPLLITTGQHIYQGGQVGRPVDWTITVAGGQTPYTVTWNWGDGVSDTDHTTAGALQRSHAYAKPGTYQITLRVTDAAHHEAVMQVVAIVAGPTTGAITSGPRSDAGNLIFVWPLLVIVSLIVISFWLGERHKLATTRLRPATP
jgi:hypothetical protein